MFRTRMSERRHRRSVEPAQAAEFLLEQVALEHGLHAIAVADSRGRRINGNADGADSAIVARYFASIGRARGAHYDRLVSELVAVAYPGQHDLDVVVRAFDLGPTTAYAGIVALPGDDLQHALDRVVNGLQRILGSGGVRNPG